MQAPDILAHEAAAAPSPPGAPRPWWEGRPFVAIMILLAFVPLLYPPIPPLVDLGGHMGRYKVALDLHSSPYLAQWFGYQWKPIGNLGVDALVNPLAWLIGLEPAVKLVILFIPPMTVAGMLWVAREVHNRLPPTVAFALPLAYGHPLLFGFVNFSLSMAFAMLAFGLWLRLGRLGKSKLRAALFVPISFLVFFTHAFGWGTLGLMCFSAEAVRQHDRGLSWWKAGLRAAYHASAMALPLVLMILWRTEAHGGRTVGWFVWARKWEYLVRVLRDHWKTWDLVSAAIVYAMPVFAILHRKLTLSRNLFFSALVLAAGFIALPRVVFGSAYADMRMVPYLAAILILAIRFRADTDYRLARTLALAGLAFLLARTATTTTSFAIQSNHQQAQLKALNVVPRGARVVSLVNAECHGWTMHRSDHLPSLAVVRRDAFSNDQWPLAGSSLLTVHYRPAGRYAMDPSQVVRLVFCPREGQSIPFALRHIPREAFDYLWLLDFPPTPRSLVDGWNVVFVGEGSILLRRSDLDGGAPPPATPRTASAPAR